MSDKKTENFVVGMDIGYSNLVASFGFSDQTKPERTTILPAGAGPLALLPRDVMGGHSLDGAALVQIDGESWVAGVQPERLSGKSRELHEDYPATDVYRALFYATLALAEREVIDVLVTGLPVNQYSDQALREKLAERLKGKHQVTAKTSVTVKDVYIVPQPAGTYLTALQETSAGDPLADSLDSGLTLVLDPGFFSVDWVAFENGDMGADTAGTDLRAMSRVLDATADLMHEDYGIRPTVHRIEAAVRAGRKDIVFQGKRVDFEEYFKKASKAVADSVLVTLRSSLRDKAGSSIDAIIAGGGGGASYIDSAKEAFPNAIVTTVSDPVTSNSVGFWHCAR